MASRFTQGASIKTTVTTSKKAVDPKPGMHGMPGYLKTGADASSAGLASTKGSGAHREGPIGQRGSMGVKKMDSPQARGSMDKNYRATSTGPGASIKANTAVGQKGSSRTGGSEKEGPARGKPSRGAPMYGGTAPSPKGHAGRMESMKGRARTSWER